MRVAAIQHDIVWERPVDNFRRLAPMIAQAADGGARLVALTEMYATGFSMAAECDIRHKSSLRLPHPDWPQA